MSTPLSEQTLSVITQTAPFLQENAEALTRHFYQRMFAHNPEVRPYFNPAHQQSGRQQRALAGAIVAYATHIADLSVLGGAVELIAHKHASLGVQPEHYPIVGEHLLASIAELLAGSASDEEISTIVTAWAEAYGLLAQILIGREQELYEGHERQHGWRGFRSFEVVARIKESEEITSFHLVPADHAPLAPHQAGQYVTVRAPSEATGSTMRNYSISSAPGEPYYRISVKREGSAGEVPGGHVSRWLHDEVQVGDEVEVGPPCGEFSLTETQAPLVLIGGGVGMTPLLSMAHAAAPEREVCVIQSARDGRVRAFEQELKGLLERHPGMTLHVCQDEVSEGEEGVHPGRIDAAWLLGRLPQQGEAEVFLCGPREFMAAAHGALRELGVRDEQVRYECFGPLQPV